MAAHSRFTDDLSRKMFDTLDLKQNPQKANFSFRQPTHKIGKRPQAVTHISSTKAANWSNMNLDDEFIVSSQNIQPSIFPTNNGNNQIPNLYGQPQPLPQAANTVFNAPSGNWNTAIPTQPQHQAEDDFGDFIESSNAYPATNVVSTPQGSSTMQNHSMTPAMSQELNAKQNNAFMTNQMNLPITGHTFNNSHYTGQTQINIQPNFSAFGQQAHNNTPAYSNFDKANPIHNTTATSNSLPDDFGDFTEFPAALNISNSSSNSSMHKPTSRQDVPPPTVDVKLDYRRLINSPPAQRPISQPPFWVTNPAHVPELYRQVLGVAGLPDGMVETSIIYPILVSSGLSQQVLGEIWSAVNKKSPGQLTFSEMFVALNLIAMAQKSVKPLTWERAISYRTPLIPNVTVNSSTTKPVQQNNFGNSMLLNNNPADNTSTSSDYSAVSNIENDDFGDFQSVSEPVISKPPTASSNTFINNFTKPDASKNPPQDLLEIGADKYSAFRDVTLAPAPLPSIFEMHKNEIKTVGASPPFQNETKKDLLSDNLPPDENDFADFQSCDDLNGTQNFPTNNIHQDILSANHSTNSTTGKVDNFDLFSTWDSPAMNSAVKSEPAFINPLSDFNSMSTVTNISTGTQDVEPSIYKNLNKIDNKHSLQTLPSPKVQSPPRIKVKLPDVSKVSYFSDTEDDFGEFSEPPPIDTAMGEDEFDTYAAGNSALHDFDALDHFEEEKRQVKTQTKLQVQPAKKNIKKVDQTAFNHISTVHTPPMSPPTPIKPAKNIASDPIQNPVLDAKTDDFKLVKEEDWGNFSDEDYQNTDSKIDSDWGSFTDDEMDPTKPTIDPKWTTNTHLTMSEMINESISVIDLVSKNKVDKNTEKVEVDALKPIPNLVTTIQNVNHENTDVNGNSDSDSELDPEVADIKARMQGKGSVNPLDLYSDHWSRCLSTCNDIIKSANEIFSELKSPSVCNQVVNSTRGRDFISDVSEVYGVSRRIQRSMTEVGLKDDEIIKLTKDIDFAWNNLLGFCPYTPSVHKTPQHRANITNTENKNTKYCGLCLLDTSKDDSVDYPMSISYGDRGYHAACANLWLNQVAPMLPRLELSIIKESM